MLVLFHIGSTLRSPFVFTQLKSLIIWQKDLMHNIETSSDKFRHKISMRSLKTSVLWTSVAAVPSSTMSREDFRPSFSPLEPGRSHKSCNQLPWIKTVDCTASDKTNWALHELEDTGRSRTKCGVHGMECVLSMHPVFTLMHVSPQSGSDEKGHVCVRSWTSHHSFQSRTACSK